ncbi:hypothetical protein YTPLAS18_10430 [Nitrospira sp.]|nr:hypothetical protein YTPLAS18_10430 [Nitrospira sp.]
MSDFQRGFRDHSPSAVWKRATGTILVLLLQVDICLAGTARHPSVVTPQQGIATASKAIALDPRHTKAYLRRAGYHLALARDEGGDRHLRAAADDFAKAAHLAPKNPMIHRQYAETAARLQEYQLAVSEYSAALKLAPKHAPSYLGRGLAYLALRKDRQAKTDFARAVKLKPALRKQLEREERRIRLVRLAHEAATRLNQTETMQDSPVEGISPDLTCTGTVPIHLTAQCSPTGKLSLIP